MKITTASLAVAFASFASIVIADNCTPGLTYCGYNLLQKGDYRGTIELELESMGEAVTENAINNALYLCRSGIDGAIYFLRHCKDDTVCSDGGLGQKDYCG